MELPEGLWRYVFTWGVVAEPCGGLAYGPKEGCWKEDLARLVAQPPAGNGAEPPVGCELGLKTERLTAMRCIYLYPAAYHGF